MRAPTRLGYRNTYDRFGYPPDAQKLAMAAHEAAHAVVAASIGCRVTAVHIERRANGHLAWDGACDYRNAPGSDVEQLVQDAAITIAASVGQQHLESDVRCYMPSGMTGGDADDFARIVDELGEVSYRDLRSQSTVIAEMHLTRHAAAWRALTYALMRRGRLGADDLHALAPELFPIHDSDDDEGDSTATRRYRTSSSGVSRTSHRRTTSRDLIPSLEYRTGGPITLVEGRRTA